jgi:phenylpropionate dioxygenase-like ring-hydroxylating dioxygenase large terminal subunit
MIDDPLLINDWHVVARASELKPGEIRPVRLLGNDVVLWRNSEGLHAWQDLCLHRGAKLSGGHLENDCLACPYHGWQYNSAGQCVKIPAHPLQPPPSRAKTKTFQVRERYDFIWVSLGRPESGIPAFPEWEDNSFRKVFAGPYLFKAHGPRVIENFLDVGHFPFVHAGFLGDAAHTEIGDYEVESDENGVIARDIAVWQPDPDGTGQAAQVKYTYQAPCAR